MKEIDACEAKNQRGKAVARLVPARRRADPEEARAASRRIRERAVKLKPKVTLEEIKEWINEGRP